MRAVFVLILILLALPLQAQEKLPGAQATLELEWEEVPDALSYEVKLTPKAGGAPIVIKASEAKISHRVPTGTYNLSIRSQDKANGYFGPWSAPSEVEVELKQVELLAPGDNSSLAEPKENRLEVAFEWAPFPGVKAYTIKIWSEDKPEPVEVRTRETKKKLKLLTGKVYYWQVTFETLQSVGYQSEPLTYSFTILGRQLVTPVINKKISQTPSMPLNWKASAGAEFYHAKILRRALDETEWSPFAEVAEFKGDTWNPAKKLIPGVYRIEVSAHAKHKVSSETAIYEFNIKPTEEELAAALKPTLQLPGPDYNPRRLPAATKPSSRTEK